MSTHKYKLLEMEQFNSRRDRFALIFGVLLVLLTVFLIIDIQVGLNITHNYSEPYDIGVIRDDSDLGVGHEKNEDQRMLAFPDLGGLMNLRKYIGASDFTTFDEDVKQVFHKFMLYYNEEFADVQKAVDDMERNAHISTESVNYRSLHDLLGLQIDGDASVLDKFNLAIRQNELYAVDSTLVDALIRDMATRKIVFTGQQPGTTQIKLEMEFDNKMKAIAKPKRTSREQQTLSNHIYYADYERHTSEIAAFHLDRVLGFRRTMPVVGRTINVTRDIYEQTEDGLKNTFFVSPQPDNNHCFFGKCASYCDVFHPVCGDKDQLEVSLCANFPENFGVNIINNIHPWARSYSVYRKAVWELDHHYCDKVKSQAPFNDGRLLLDLIDMAIMDFLMGNMDRRNYSLFDVLGNGSFVVNFDNGKGFGRADYDELSILAPLTQCCMVRSSTVKTLLKYHNGAKRLSDALSASMAIDPLSPILWQPHLEALNRRVGIVLASLRDCIEHNSAYDVIYPHDRL